MVGLGVQNPIARSGDIRGRVLTGHELRAHGETREFEVQFLAPHGFLPDKPSVDLTFLESTVLDLATTTRTKMKILVDVTAYFSKPIPRTCCLKLDRADIRATVRIARALPGIPLSDWYLSAHRLIERVALGDDSCGGKVCSRMDGIELDLAMAHRFRTPHHPVLSQFTIEGHGEAVLDLEVRRR